MATMTIFDLPNELLEGVFLFLDWDRSSSLAPSRPDLFSVSETSRRLRQAVLPTLFRTVTLKLRWVDGALTEPALFRMRRQAPDLVKHVRCVYIHTFFGQYRDKQWKMKPFIVPEGVTTDWIDPIESDVDDGLQKRQQVHKKRVQDVAKKLLNSPEYTELLHKCPKDLRDHAQALTRQLFGDIALAEHDSSSTPGKQIRAAYDRLGEETYFDDAQGEAAATAGVSTRLNRCQNLRLRLDALVIVLLCLPPSINALVFEALPSNRVDTPQSSFALNVAAMAIDIFGDRLQMLKAISCHSRGYHTSMTWPDSNADLQIPSQDVLAKLEGLEVLALAPQYNARQGETWLDLGVGLKRWHILSSTVKQFELWNVRSEPQTLVSLIKEFKDLRILILDGVQLVETVPQNLGRTGRTNDTQWLSFLIGLRRKMPDVEFDLRKLHISSGKSQHGSATRWLLNNAVPTGSTVDFERETRLMEDFASFQVLWLAEDSERGQKANEARNGLHRQLIDEAMTSRWRNMIF